VINCFLAGTKTGLIRDSPLPFSPFLCIYFLVYALFFFGFLLCFGLMSPFLTLYFFLGCVLCALFFWVDCSVFSELFLLLTSGSSFSAGTKTIARLILLCVAPPLSLLLSVNLCLFYSVFLLCFFFSSGSSSGFWVLFFSSPSLCFFFVLLLCFFPPLLLRLSLIFRPKESPPFSSDFRPLL